MFFSSSFHLTETRLNVLVKYFAPAPQAISVSATELLYAPAYSSILPVSNKPMLRNATSQRLTPPQSLQFMVSLTVDTLSSTLQVKLNKDVS